MGPGGETVQTWWFREAYPMKWTGPTLNATSNAMATETLEIAHAGRRWSSLPPTPPEPREAELRIEGGETIPVLFNPREYSIAKTNPYTFKPVASSPVPAAQFGGGARGR